MWSLARGDEHTHQKFVKDFGPYIYFKYLRKNERMRSQSWSDYNLPSIQNVISN